MMMAEKNAVSDFVGVSTNASLDHGGEISCQEYMFLFQEISSTSLK